MRTTLGISACSYLAVRLGVALPEAVEWRHVVGMSALAGVVFTMSLFIMGLGFEDAALVNEAKMGILAASLIAARPRPCSGVSGQRVRIPSCPQPSAL